MKKKTLLFTTLAGTMLATGLTLSGVNAATEVTSKAKLVVNAPEDGQNAIIVELMKENPKLTEEEVTALIEEKYKTQKLTVADITPVQEDGTVGTGAVITLNTGKKFTVVLYGDTDGNGKVETDDAQVLVDYKYNGKKLTNAQLLAADVLMDDERASTSDAQRIFEYAWNPTHVDGGYAKEEYADWYKEVREVVAEPITLKVAKAIKGSSADADNTDAIGEVALDGNEVAVRVKNLKTALESTFTEILHGSVSAKWYRINLDPQLANKNWTVEGAEKETNGDIWLKAEDEETKIKLTNPDDPTEVMELTVRIVDATNVTLKTARMVTPKEGNNVQIETVKPDVAFTTTPKVTVDANVNSMTENEVEGVKGRWYTIELITDMPASKLEAIKYTAELGAGTENEEDHVYYKVEGSDTPLASTDSYYTTGEAYNANTPRYAVKLYLDGLTGSGKVIVKNKETLSTELTTIASTAASQLDVVLTNNSRVQAKAYAAKAPANTGAGWVNTDKDSKDEVMKKNQAAITVTEALTRNVVEVKGKLNEMVKYNLSNNKVETAENGNGVNEAGKRYYGLVLNIGTAYPADQVLVEGDVIHSVLNADLRAFNSNSNTADSNNTQSILFWLDADKEETTFTLVGGGTTEGGAHPERMTITVKFIDVSRVTNETVAPIAENNVNDNSKAITVASNSKAVTSYYTGTVNVNARLLGMKETTRTNILDGTEVKGKWYALKIKTTVDRSLLLLDASDNSQPEFTEKYPDSLVPCDDLIEGFTGLASDEIVLWVNASATNASSTGMVYKIKNKNDASNQTQITIKTTDTSELKLGTLAATTSTVSDAMKRAFSNDETNIANYAYNNTSARFNVTSGSASAPYKVSLELNALREYTNPNGAKGKWVAIKLGLTNTDHVVAENGIDVTNASTFGANGAVLIWLDASKLSTEKPNTFTLSATDNDGLVETVEYTITVTDSSVLTGVDKENTGTNGKTDIAWDGTTGDNPISADTSAAQAFVTNMKLVDKTVEIVDEHTINIYADVNNMVTSTPTAAKAETPSKYIAMFVGLNKADATKVYRSAEKGTDPVNQGITMSGWTYNSTDTTGTHTTIEWLDLGTADGYEEGATVKTVTLKYYYKTAKSNELPDESMEITVNVIQKTPEAV